MCDDCFDEFCAEVGDGSLAGAWGAGVAAELAFDTAATGFANSGFGASALGHRVATE